MGKLFKIVAVGGTFDEFHKGHRVLLNTAFELSECVLVGLCSDDFVEKMVKPHEVAPFAVRLEELKSYLMRHGWLKRAEIIPLYNAYGPALISEKLQAIIVSKETEARALEINEKRRAKGLQTLKVVTIDMIMAENYDPISTTRIRRLEIDREGYILKRKKGAIK